MMSQTPSQTSAGRAPAHRSISTLFPAPLFEDKSLGKTFGGISRDGSHGWIVGDSELFVFDLQGEDGPRRKAELAADLQEDQATAEKFLCVTEVTIRGESFLAASTRELQGGDSALLLFDLRSCKICSTIKLPYSASAILQLDGLSGHKLSAEHEPLLTQFASCLLLGTTGGHLLALDLDFVHHRQEVREMELKYPGTEFDPVRFSAEHPNHIPCVALNSEQHQGGRFQYQQDRGDAILLPEKAVHVTALAYSREFDALAVGFNFGTFQLWSLTAERMLYSSPIGEGGLATKVPVSHFLFQCDQDAADLTGSAYLWIGRSTISSPLHSSTHAAEVQLFNIKFKAGPSIGHIGSEYKKTLSAPPQAAKIIGIHLLTPREHAAEAEDGGDEQEVGGTDWDSEAGAPAVVESRSPWVLFVWEVQAADGSANRLHMGLFNLDLVSVTAGFVPLAYPFQKEKACLAMWVDPTSVSDFFACTSGLFAEERERLRTFAASAHTLPISFDVSCLYIDTYTHCSWLSDQEKALSVFGQQLLPWVDPSLGLQTTYQECKNAGLLHTLPGDPVSDAERDYRFQYKALFDMCLRLQLTSSICHLATLTRDDGVYVFPNPRIVLEWAWERYSAFNDALNDHSSNLYLSTLSVGNRRAESAFADQLRRIAGRMWGVKHVFEALLSRHDNTDKGQKNLEEKYQQVVHALQHLKLMMWVREKIENWLFVGDSQTIDDQFQERRQRRKELYAETQRRLTGHVKEDVDLDESMSTSSDDEPSLFIELLLAAHPMDQPLYYPPHHLSDFLRTLFSSTAHPEPLKHAIVYYCLRDLVGWGKIKESLLQDYARRFHLATPYVRLVEGLWGLDRGLPEDIPTAWKNLTEVSGDAAAILENWKGRVLRLLYDLGARAQALYFLRWMQPPAVTPADAILHMQILLESDLLSQAFNYQRLRFASAATPAELAVRRTLLEHLFQFFLATGRMNELFKFHLDAGEEEALVHFLTAKAKGPGLEQLIHFFLQRGRYVEAMRAYKELTSSAVPLLPPERAQFLECLIQNYKLALPSVALQPPPSLSWPSSLPGTSASSSTTTAPSSSSSTSSSSSSSLSFSLLSVFPAPASSLAMSSSAPSTPSSPAAAPTEQISFPVSPFGAPPSLQTPKRGWRSRPTDDDLTSPSNRALLASPFKTPLQPQQQTMSPFAPSTTSRSPRRPAGSRVFGGALVASPTLLASSPRGSLASPVASSQLASPLYRASPVAALPKAVVEETEEPAPVKRRLADRKSVV